MKPAQVAGKLLALALALVLVKAGAAALALAARPADRADRPTQAPALARSAQDQATHELGRKVWNFRCYFCHGYSGDARTLASTYLQPAPRDFTRTPPERLPLVAMVQAIMHGKPGTAMKGFAGILRPDEVTAVAAFVRQEFMQLNAENTRYHTPQNGWPDHERHRDAFAFARGEIALDTPWEQLDEGQQRGKRLFLATCVSCHDHGRTAQPGAVWETRAVSYPRDAYCTSCHEHADGSGARPAAAVPPAGHPPVRNAVAGGWPGSRAAADERGASTYRVHDTPPRLHAASALEKRGERLYQRNCAFCHAADGSAKSWIGRFLEPHPRDLTDPAAMAGLDRQRLVTVIEQGLEGTSMPGWKQVLRPAEIDALVAYIHRAFHPIHGM